MSKYNILPQHAFSVSAAFSMKAFSIIPNRYTELGQIFYSLKCLLLGATVYAFFGQLYKYDISLVIGWAVWFILFLAKNLVNTVSVVVRLFDLFHFR